MRVVVTRRAWRLVVLVASLAALGGMVCADPDDKILPLHAVPLASGTFVPGPGLDPLLEPGAIPSQPPPAHVVVQLFEKATTEMRERLQSQGVTLLERLFAHTYFARRTPDDLDLHPVVADPAVRAIFVLRPSDKIAPDLTTGPPLRVMTETDGTWRLLVRFHVDVRPDEARAVLQRWTESFERFGQHSWEVRVRRRQSVDGLALEDTVRWVEAGPLPHLPLSDHVREAIHVDGLHDIDMSTDPPGYNGVSGDGVCITIVEPGADDDHDDFWDHGPDGDGDGEPDRTSKRLLRINSSYSVKHGTVVAGLAGGNGFQSHRLNTAGQTNGDSPYLWRGMAPSSTLVVVPGDPGQTQPFQEALALDGPCNEIEVSNHSYVQTLGGYTQVAADIDKLVRGDLAAVAGFEIPPRPQVWAAGNNGFRVQDENFLAYGQAKGYFSILAPAKNPIVVGTALLDLNPKADPPMVRHKDSSLGPTRDGRLKPDLMAPGCHLKGITDGVRAPHKGVNGYESHVCASSWAAAVVSGTIAMLLEEWSLVGNTGQPWPSTVKAALIQGADDMEDLTSDPRLDEEPNPDTTTLVRYPKGPDYATGFGLLNAEQSLDVITEDRWIQGEITFTGEEKTYEIDVPAGSGRFRVTLAWDDAPGSVGISETVNRLVNDLDLWLESPAAGEFRPWLLPKLTWSGDPAAPDEIQAATLLAPAPTGPDHVNNVEQVEVTGPADGVWTIHVSGHDIDGEQRFSLAFDHFPFSEEEVTTGTRSFVCRRVFWPPDKGIWPSSGVYRCYIVAVRDICRYRPFLCRVCKPGAPCLPIQFRFENIGANTHVFAMDDQGRTVAHDTSSNKNKSVVFEREPDRSYRLVFQKQGKQPFKQKEFAKWRATVETGPLDDTDSKR